MSKNAFSHRAFVRFLLLAALVLAGLPAQAREAHPPARQAHGVTVPGDGVWRFVLNLLPRGMWKEGILIDPNGSSGHQGAGTTPAGIAQDPNGRQ
jgi:hypothetical protein